MPNEKRTMPVLAIHPSKRKMGVAVLDGRELIFWGVTGFREQDVRALLDLVKKRVEALLQTYQPGMLVIERPSRTRLKASPALEMIVERLNAVALAYGLQFRFCEAGTVREHLCGSARATRREMVERIVARYPHLARYAGRSSQWRESYWLPMFAAVGVGVVSGAW